MTFVGAGDIASSSWVDGATATLLDQIGGTVFTLGDNVYASGTSAEFAAYYEPTWGRHKARTFAVPGNHDYESPGAAPYFDYFFAGNPTMAALDPSRRGYYSFDLGAWRIVALNSSNGAPPSQQQLDWLRADLQQNKRPCTLAYWHHPRFNSGHSYANNANMDAFWRVAHQYGVDVVLNGHAHVYERFDPQTHDAQPDPTGIRAFTVGTGGASMHAFGPVQANSAVRLSGLFGVIQLTLRADGYDWRFVKIADQQGAPGGDAGSSACTNVR